MPSSAVVALPNNSPLPLFNIAQTFYVDPNLVSQQNQVQITSVDMYFMYKPAQANNISGVNNPGITVYITDTIYNVPKITANTYQQSARLEWNAIVTSSDATRLSKFIFNNPVTVVPGKSYAFLVAYDGNEQFTPWAAIDGAFIINTRTPYNGPTGNLIGNYYEFVNNASLLNDGVEPDNLTQEQYLSFWTPVINQELQFNVNMARYFSNNVAILQSNAIPTNALTFPGSPFQSWNANTGVSTFNMPAINPEAISFNISTSQVQTFVGAQRVFQNTVPYPGGWVNGASYVTVSVQQGNVNITANTNLPNGALFNWNTVFNNYTGTKMITLVGNSGGPNVRKVTNILSNTVITVDEPITFSNTLASFLVTPVGTIDSILPSSPFGKAMNLMFLNNSNANSTVRFVNNSILAITPNAGGSGYNNTDVLYVKGYQFVSGKEIGGYVAVGNIVTNSTGGITNVFMSNLGCGFVNATNIVAVLANSTNIGNTTSNTSAGTSATFNYTVGCTLITELSNNIFQNCIVSNFNINDVTPFFNLTKGTGVTASINFSSQYYIVNDNSTLSGFAYYVANPPQSYPVELGVINNLLSANAPCFVSYSNEFVTSYANGGINDQVSALTQYSNNFTLQVNSTTVSDYSSLIVGSTPTIEFGHYIINNDYTNENTNQGNAWFRHVTNTINFSIVSEDIRVYMSAYQPPNTSFQVFARIQNTADNENFIQEDWTRLMLLNANTLYSSPNQSNNYIELQYGFQPQPNSQFTLGGMVATVNNSATITGSNTTFQANLAVGNLIKIYDPLFPNTNFIVASVTGIASNTSLTIDQPILSTINPSLVQSGMLVDKMAFVNQAYNNITNENVVRYYNTSIAKYDGYNTLQIKVIGLSSAFQAIPQIHNIRAIGISA